MFLYFRKIVPLFNIHKKLIKSINNYILLPFGVEVLDVISNNKIEIVDFYLPGHSFCPVTKTGYSSMTGHSLNK